MTYGSESECAIHYTTTAPHKVSIRNRRLQQYTRPRDYVVQSWVPKRQSSDCFMQRCWSQHTTSRAIRLACQIAYQYFCEAVVRLVPKRSDIMPHIERTESTHSCLMLHFHLTLFNVGHFKLCTWHWGISHALTFAFLAHEQLYDHGWRYWLNQTNKHHRLWCWFLSGWV